MSADSSLAIFSSNSLTKLIPAFTLVSLPSVIKWKWIFLALFSFNKSYNLKKCSTLEWTLPSLNNPIIWMVLFLASVKKSLNKALSELLFFKNSVIRGPCWFIFRPAPIVMWPISLLPNSPGLSPTYSSDASKVVWG